MKEADRKQRNQTMLQELYPAFRNKLVAVIADLESRGLRPRIQCAWRSPDEQMAAFNSGNSKLKYGFHNVTGANGAKESLAVDLLDDDSPLDSRKSYLLQLADAAKILGLNTGIRWGVPPGLVPAIDTAIANKDWQANVKIGWDPTHVEPLGITPAQAKAGARPV